MRTAPLFVLWLTVLAVLTATATAGEPQPALPDAVAGPSGAVAWLDCRLAPVPGQEKARLLIMTVGDRVERAVVVPLGMAAVDVSGLKVEGGRITGQILVSHGPREQNHAVPPLAGRMPLRLDLTIQDGQVDGTFAGSWPKGGKGRVESTDVKGKVSGERLDEARLRVSNGLAADAAWPSWLGPNQVKFSQVVAGYGCL